MTTKRININRCKPLLGTYVSIDISAELDFEGLARISSIGYEAIIQVQALMSYHEPASQLSLINSKAHKTPILLHPHTEAVIKFAKELAEKTNGLFDPSIAPHLVKQGLLPDHYSSIKENSNWKNITIDNHHIFLIKPTHLDLGGIAKGYAVDLARSVMEKEFLTLNITNPQITINAGGDLTESHWQGKLIYIRDSKTAAPAKQIEMQNTAVATSSYCFQEKNRYPIIDPIKNKPHKLTKSISIFSPSCMVSDALTKVYAISPCSNIHEEYNATHFIF